MSDASTEIASEVRCRQELQVSNLSLNTTDSQTSQHPPTPSAESNKQEDSIEQEKNCPDVVLVSIIDAQSSNEKNGTLLTDNGRDFVFNDDSLNRECLKRSLVFICQNLASKEVIVHLEAKCILTQPDADSIRAKKISFDRNRKLVHIIQQRGSNAFICFMEALKESYQRHIYEAIIKERQTIAESKTRRSMEKSTGINGDKACFVQNFNTYDGDHSSYESLWNIQHSLREMYSERFRKVNPFSVPFAFDIENKWVNLTLKLDDNSAPTEYHVDLINKAFAKVKMLIIEGDPASGKTSLLRRIAYEWNQKKSQLSHYDLVLYVEFREVWGKEFKSITEMVSCYMNSHLHKQDYEKLEILIADDKYCKEHKILVLLDGYDESSLKKQYKKSLKKQCHESLKKQCQELKDYLFSNTIGKPLRFNIVLTSRKGYLSELRQQEGRFAFASVLGFTTELQKQEYISKHFDTESSDITTTLYNIVKTNENFKTLSETPLMLTFFCLLHKKIHDGTVVELYMNIIWWLLDRHQKHNPDRDVPALFGFRHTESDKFRVIQDHYLHFPELHKLGKMAMLDIFKTTFTKNDIEQSKLTEVAEHVGLLRKDEKRDDSYRITTEFSFPHRTIQEFITALTFFFSKEEPPENFCWFIFDKGRKISNGIIQKNLYTYLQMIKSSKIELDVSSKVLFSKMEERLTKNTSYIRFKRDQTLHLDRKMYTNNFRLISDKGFSIPQSEEAIELLKYQAEEGHANSQYILGFMYQNGRGVPQSHEEAVKWYRKAAEQGDVDGQNNLGFMYDEGQGVQQSDTEAVKWFTKSAEQGNADAQYNLGFMYLTGRGILQSDEGAAKWFRKAAEQGDANGQNDLGLMYRSGRGISQSDEEAVKWYRKAAEQGNEYGQYNLGVMYQDGRGVSQSDEEAVKWYRKAAEQGNQRGQNNLALMYQNGRGVSQSDEEAVKWYRKAAEQGNQRGQNNLALMYQNGRGVSQSDEEAVQWFRKAAEQGNANGQCNLGFMYDNGQGVPQSDEEAVKWYTKAAEQGYARGQNNLGDMYYYGRGVPQSDEEAVKWYRQAAEQGHVDGQCNLGFMYQNGRRVSQSEEEAVKC